MTANAFTTEDIEAVAGLLEESASALRAAVVRMREKGLDTVDAHFASTKDIYALKVYTQCVKLMHAVNVAAKVK